MSEKLLAKLFPEDNPQRHVDSLFLRGLDYCVYTTGRFFFRYELQSQH